MLNPQQNININISYNLSQNKKEKVSNGKKINKIQKPSYSQSTGQCDIEIKLKNKNTEELKRSHEHKISNDTKKVHKKKPSAIGRNTFTPDLFNDRRIRTEGPSADQENSVTLKKESKYKVHSKSTQPAQSKLGVSAKRIGTNKTTKSLKAGHVNSFILINAKKNQIDSSETNVTKKRRVQSAFAKNDKVVSKLLNMSLLASELGGSRPITSERRCIESHSKTFKEYLSSIDMRILKTMSDDVPIFTTRINSQQQTVKSIMKFKCISLQELTRKIIIIQKAWKRSMKKKIVNKYKLLFQHATDKLVKSPSHQISGFAAESVLSDIHYFGSLPEDQLGLSIPLSNSLNSLNINSLSNDNSLNSHQIKWIEQSNSLGEESEREKLNLAKYRQLVVDEINKNNKKKGKSSNKPNEEQLEQWNNINKKLSNIMNDRKQFDPTSLLDDFIQQSTYNKEWIENEYEASSRKESRMNSAEKVEQSASKAEISSSHEDARPEDRQEEGQEDSLDESQGYDNVKYGSPDEEHEVLEKRIQELEKIKRIERGKRDIFNSQSPSSEQKWTSPNLLEDNVVKGYLDCGLADFGLNINQKILKIDDNDEDLHKQFENQYLLSSDEAIGVKFEQANRGIVRRTHQQLDPEPSSSKFSFKGRQIDDIVEGSIQNLISEFASDISHILKKSTQSAPPPEKRLPQPQPRPACIQTNFNSIKDYITKFVKFIQKEQPNFTKILDNINKDIGPTSLQILSYLRPESEEMPIGDNQSQSFQEEGLFVIPADLFQQFQTELQNQFRIQNQKEMGPRVKAYSNFWHRCIFQSFNQCLDYERPYGIEGKPYDWVTQTKVFRKVKRSDIKKRLESGENRLLEMTLMVGGIIFEKPDSPFANADFSEQEKHRINEERLSRILATELLQSEQSWINYNDEMAELLVELSRMIQDKIFFEHITEMKKLQRRRKIITGEAVNQEAAFYNI